MSTARWFLGIEEPLNETETEGELYTEQRREHLQSWAGLPQLGGENNGQGWNRKGGDVCSVHLLDSGVTNICLCGLVGTDGLPSLLVLLVDLGMCPLELA